ncbi:MAG: hydrogenase [Bacteroidales bacterium]|nr:hydrogenase [Bacteroidales bacterium]
MENLKSKKQQSDNLLFFGVLLFFLGLIVGLFIPMMANPRMGLSSHLEGLLNGIFLIVLGLIWNKLEISVRWLSITFWLSLFGTFANWLSVLIAAVFNSGKMMPLAAGKEGNPIPEGIVTFLLLTLTLAMLAICIIVMTGLYKYMRSGRENTSMTFNR